MHFTRDATLLLLLLLLLLPQSLWSIAHHGGLAQTTRV
jgi:hypothetical protein